ncbi:hypothetical protein E5288_WYG022730 [Bos mutus]|uniref:Uncharacterized protein n=1 Tax=Bos mutus TaxID=72004 RepID=A0A6B0R1K4_9CETA|nr:hypothetical protein [Bos mutus]
MGQEEPLLPLCEEDSHFRHRGTSGTCDTSGTGDTSSTRDACGTGGTSSKPRGNPVLPECGRHHQKLLPS